MSSSCLRRGVFLVSRVGVRFGGVSYCADESLFRFTGVASSSSLLNEKFVVLVIESAQLNAHFSIDKLRIYSSKDTSYWLSESARADFSSSLSGASVLINLYVFKTMHEHLLHVHTYVHM